MPFDTHLENYLSRVDNVEPKLVIKESSESSLSFNVMPGKRVREKLFIREYRVWDDKIEGRFDREYESDMVKSPDHLIFLSALVHFQKLIYVYLCSYFKLPYDPFGLEVLKIWPTDITCKIPRLIRESNDLVQSVYFSSIERVADRTFCIEAMSIVQNSLIISGSARVILLGHR